LVYVLFQNRHIRKGKTELLASQQSYRCHVEIAQKKDACASFYLKCAFLIQIFSIISVLARSTQMFDHDRFLTLPNPTRQHERIRHKKPRSHPMGVAEIAGPLIPLRRITSTDVLPLLCRFS
jgi:hypothetical protein